MNEEDKPLDFQHDTGEADDVEILEVVGVDEDAPALDGSPDVAEPDPEQPNEILLAFDDDDEAAEPAEAPAAPEPEEDAGATEDRLLRLRADYENLRKRITREREEFEQNANSSLVGRLLPTLDNFERALAAKSRTGAEKAFHDGFNMIYKQLLEELASEGLRAIESVGEPFDPNLHDAVATDPESTEPANTVIEEFQRGYLFRERVLRHAMVKVSTNGSGEPAPGEDEDQDEGEVEGETGDDGSASS